MADKRISQLDDAVPLAGAEAIPIVQAGQTRKATPLQLVAAAAMQSAEDRTEGRVVTVDYVDQIVIAQFEQQPIRVSPNTISADVTIAAGYNGVSAGPITIREGAVVSVTPDSHWSIL